MDPILQILRRNANQPREEIARMLDLSTEQVNQKIEEYEKAGVILGYQAVIDTEVAGNGEVTAVIEVKITPERGGGFDRLAERIAKFDQVTSCYLMSGGYDLLVFVEGANLREVARFVSEKLSSLDGVLSTATHFRLKAYKANGLLLQREPAQDRLAVTP
jgi:DNA-binding Lrp family transcriptional regulator